MSEVTKHTRKITELEIQQQRREIQITREKYDEYTLPAEAFSSIAVYARFTPHHERDLTGVQNTIF